MKRPPLPPRPPRSVPAPTRRPPRPPLPSRPPVAVPPPAKLTGAAAERWASVYPELAGRGPVDAERLASYCQAWARWRAAEDAIAKLSETNPLGGQLTKGAGGRVTKSPLVGIANQNALAVRQLEQQLGLGEAGPAPADGGGLYTRFDLAPRLKTPAHPNGVHPQTIVKWEKEGCPVARRGRRGIPSLYSEADVRAWLQAREASAPGGATDLIRERANKERWQGQLAEQQFLVRQKQLLPAADVERAWSAIVAACRAVILNSYSAGADRVFRAASTEGLAGVEREMKAIAFGALRELGIIELPEDTPPTPEGRAA